MNKKAFCVLEFVKTESIVTVQWRFRIMYHTEPPTDKTIREWYMNSSRVAAFVLRNEQAVRAHRWFCVVHDPKPPLHSHNWLSFGKFQDTERFLIHCERHFSSRLPPSDGTWKYARAPSTKKNLERFSTYWYATVWRVCLGCCAVEFGNPGGTYE